jgi:hypothetical protein
MPYLNGQIPNSVVSVVLGSGRDSKGRFWEHRLTPATAARWRFAVDYALRKWGKRMSIRWGGPNAYRPLEFQWFYYNDGVAQGNPLQAAYPGTSSHGGDWRGRLCLAIDVDPGGLTWAQVWEACRAAGFACGLITKAIAGIDEPWHVIDFAAFGPVPAFADATSFVPEISQGDHEMYAMRVPNDPARGAVAVSLERNTALTDEEFDNFYGGLKYDGINARQYDLNLAVARRMRADEAQPETFLGKGQSASRPWTLFSPGYVRVLTQEEFDNNPFTVRRIEGNDRQYDVWRAMSLGGAPALDLASLASELSKHMQGVDDVDEQEIAKALAPLLTYNVERVPDEDLQRIAVAAADEADRRARERLGQG